MARALPLSPSLARYGIYLVLFVVLFFNLYCTRDPRRPAPPSPNGKKSLGDRLVEFKPGCDVGDAAGFFRGKELSDANLKDA